MNTFIEQSKSLAKIHREKEFKAIDTLQQLDNSIINGTANEEGIDQYDNANKKNQNKLKQSEPKEPGLDQEPNK